MPEIQVGGRDNELSSLLSSELVSYNIATTGVSDMSALSIKVVDDDGELIAGLDGVSWGTAMLIETLWVHADHRRDGWGRKLVAAAETEARNRACTDISVCSFTFQAPDFYKRLGYVETGRRIGYPNNAADVVMWKSLTGAQPVRLAVIVDFEDDAGKAYEDEVLTMLGRHGGRVEQRLSSADRRTEIHVIWFGDRASYEAFRADPRRPPRPAGIAARVIEM